MKSKRSESSPRERNGVWRMRGVRKGLLEALNKVYEKVDQTPDPVLEMLQLATLKRHPW